ncbi:helix-turn-helix domain-containing protein [Microbacterium oxydans]|uniref:MerR family transcriptional regulator n=1 Tax=Microbacterium oxydans TaxID=82380 RepID=UPI0009EB1A53
MGYSAGMGSDVVGPYLRTPEVLRLCGLPYSTLDSWVRTGLVTPSVRGGSGRRRTRLWSISDVVIVRALKELKEAGAPSRVLSQAHRTINTSWTDSLRGRMLFWDGHDIVQVDEWSNIISLVTNPGQTVLKIVTVPLDAYREEAEREASQGPDRSTSEASPAERRTA